MSNLVDIKTILLGQYLAFIQTDYGTEKETQAQALKLHGKIDLAWDLEIYNTIGGIDSTIYKALKSYLDHSISPALKQDKPVKPVEKITRFGKNLKAIRFEADTNFSGGFESLKEIITSTLMGRICEISSCEREAIDRMYHQVHMYNQGVQA